MLSGKHHILYWILSLTFLRAQPLRKPFKEWLAIDDDTQVILDYAIALYAIWFCLLLIERRTRLPPAPPNWQNQRPVNKKIWERAFMAVVDALVKRRAWFVEFGTSLMCLIVGDGALLLSGVGEEGEDAVKGKVVRVLATFIFLGMVEPVWRDVSLATLWILSFITCMKKTKKKEKYIYMYANGKGEGGAASISSNPRLGRLHEGSIICWCWRQADIAGDYDFCPWVNSNHSERGRVFVDGESAGRV
jgi:hypothetical protein